jgi:hypothetical protein
MIEHLEEVWQEMDRGRMNSGTVEFLETMKNAVQRALAKRTREEEEDPNHRIYRGPPRS